MECGNSQPLVPPVKGFSIFTKGTTPPQPEENTKASVASTTTSGSRSPSGDSPIISCSPSVLPQTVFDVGSVPAGSSSLSTELGSTRTTLAAPYGGCLSLCLSGLRQRFGPVVVNESSGDGRGATTKDEFERRIEFLSNVPLFQRLPRAKYPMLASKLRGVSWEAGQVVVEQQAQLKEFMLIASGCAELYVEVPGSDSLESSPRATTAAQLLRSGDYFGEKVLTSGGCAGVFSPARIVAKESLVTLALGPAEFESIGLRKHMAFPRRRALSRCVLKQGRKAESFPKNEEEAKFIADALRGNHNLRALVDLQEETVQKLIEAAKREDVSAGKKVVQRGEYGGMFYIVESGRFELVLDGDDKSQNKHQDAFSQVRELLNDQKKNTGASSETQRRRVRKEQFLQRLAHSRDASSADLLAVVEASPRSGCRRKSWAIPSFGSTPPRGPSQGLIIRNSSDPNKISTPRRMSAQGVPAELSGLLAVPTFSQESDRQAESTPRKRELLARSGSDLSCPTTGNSAANLAYDFPTLTEDGHQILGFRGRGDCFGELALLYHAPRTSSAVAREDSVVWSVSQVQFRRIMSTGQDERVLRIVELLGKVDLLQELLSDEKFELATNFNLTKFNKGDWLVHEGDPQNVWYVVTRGECILSRQATGGAGDDELARLTFPQHFGERALLKKRPSEFSVRAASDIVECIFLDGSTFLELASHLSVEGFRRAAEDDLVDFAQFKKDQRQPKRKGFLSTLNVADGVLGSSQSQNTLPVDDADSVGILRSEPRLDPTECKRSLHRIGVLGKGAYGLVTLEMDPTTKQRFALKTVSKQHVVANQLESSIQYERKIMGMIDSPFIIRLYATFKDCKYVYFLFEPLLGGELHTHMCRHPARFRDPKVFKMVLACATNSLSHLHDRHIVYRDLKPENILLDSSGYYKLCDMGFAKFVIGKTMTLCGTPEYIAPEVINHGGYDRMVDWWAVGVLTYECVYSCTPFVGDDDMDVSADTIFNNIMQVRKREVVLPSTSFGGVSDFIKSLLRFSPSKRLGLGGAAQIRAHSLFTSFDWEALEQGKMVAPYRPKTKTDVEHSQTLRDDQLDVPCDEECSSPRSNFDNGPAWDADF